MNTPPTTSDPPLDFEKALDELEALVARMEQGELTLEQSLATYERGVALSRRCQDALERAERRIRVLTEDGQGQRLEPLDPESD